MMAESRLLSRRLVLLAITALLSANRVDGSDQSPKILADLSDSPRRVLIAAHRGGYANDKADKAPENSVANISNCQRLGYELYETDIQRTKDGHFVILHDATIERELSGSGRASELTLAELKKLFKRYRDGSLSEQRLATLEEFLQNGKGSTVFKADLKPGVNRYFGDIMKLVAKHEAQDDVIFRVPYRDAALYERYRENGAAMARHTLMFMVSSEKQLDDILKRFDPVTIQVDLNKVDPANDKSLKLIRYAVSQGLIVETHAYGNERDWAKLVHAGVRILHANAPAKVQRFLQGLPQVR